MHYTLDITYKSNFQVLQFSLVFPSTTLQSYPFKIFQQYTIKNKDNSAILKEL